MGFNWLWGTDGIRDAVLGKKDQSLETVADPYKSVREPYLDWLKSQIGQPGQSYTGQMVAPTTPQENQSLQYLQQYGNTSQAENPTFKNANKVVNDTLTGRFDPTTSPYYQAVKAESARNLKKNQETIASNSAGLGNVFTGGRVKEQGEAATASTLNLNKILGELAMQERQNQLSVIPQALGISDTLTNEPLAKTAAFQQFGALPREIEQAKNTAAYNEWLRSQVEYPMQIAQMASGTQQAPVYQQPTPSLIEQLLSGISKGAGQALPLMFL